MQGTNSLRKSLALRVAALVLLVTGVGALTINWQAPTQAGEAPFEPQVLAVYAGKDKTALDLAVVLPEQVKNTGKLTVQLLGNEGEVVAEAQDKAASARETSKLRIDKLDKARAEKTVVRVTFGERKFEVPLAKALLAKAHETALTCGQEFYAGSPGAFSITVQGVRSLTETAPLAHAEVTLKLKDKDGKYKGSFTCKTDRQGRANAEFELPEVEPGAYTLEVKTTSVLGEEKLERAIRVKSDAKILLVSDKPIYQPGQLMHIRALVLRPVDMKPVGDKDLLFEVEDSKGNKVFKKTLKTSEFGIASVDFQLADEVNMGDYHLRAALGDHRADKTVTVKRYVLPKFKVAVKSDKTFYLPKDKIQVELQSDYFFGKPVSTAKVEVRASTFDVQFREFHKWTGTTDENGHAKFDVQLPDYFVGQPLQKGNALVKLEVKVLDSADHTETVNKTYPVSDQAIRVSLIPEAGKLVPGLENRVFAAAMYPDGSPAAGCELKFWLIKRDGAKRPEGKQPEAPAKDPFATAKTNSAGLAEFKFTPKNEQFRQGNHGPRDLEMLGGRQQVWGPSVLLDIRTEAKDARGNQAVHVAELTSQPFGENVLLRLDKAIYKAGDSVNIDVRTSAGLPTVFLDVVRGGQIMLSRWYDVKDGQASQRIDLPQNVFGSLEIHAYQMLSHGEIIRDSRVVYVQSRDDLQIDVKADKQEYLPGANGRIRFQVTDSRGRPTPAALGVIIVDEAVYALQEMQPGLEKVYFTLQEELMKPKVDIKFSPGETIDNLILQPVVPAPRQQIAEVLLTAVKLPLPQRWDVNPALERRQRFQGQVQNLAATLFNVAWNANKEFLAYDKDTKAWGFRPGLLDELVNSKQMPAEFLNGPFGEKITLEDMARLEKSFTADKLAQAITTQRIHNLAWTINNFTNTHRAKYFNKDRWELPENLIDELVKVQKYDPRMVKDAWGEPFRLVKRDKKIQPSLFGPQLEGYDIVSSGPDRKQNTADDVGFAQASDVQRIGWLGGMWWLDNDERLAQGQMHWGRVRDGFRGRHELRNEVMMMRADQAGLERGGLPLMAPAAGDPRPVPDMKTEKAATGGPGGSGGTAAAPITKTREYFPETMLWQPALITDDKGNADLAVNFADSITTWRLSASANSRAGALGGINVPLKVFQDFFVDIDLPVSLTQSDEVAFPVAVYNYLRTPQTVKIELQKEGWFELLEGGLERSLDMKPNEVTSVKFRIKAGKIGFQPITVKAHGSKMSDAVKRVVEVVPNGQKYEKAISDRLSGKIVQTLDIPQNAIDDASRIMVRIYPGVLAQVVDGLDGMLRMPGGCFEQTSSSAYPNVLIVDYLRKNRISSPQMMMKAEQYLNLGYQRLLTFERPGGGFDWWGNGEPLIWLSAYGLQEFSDMAKVYPIDRGIIQRTQNFLLGKMDKDATWSNVGATHGETIASMGNTKMLLTSYVVWSLLDSGLPKAQLKKSVDFIRDNVKEVENNAYILALAANALAAYDAKDDSTLEVLQKLDKLHKDVPEWKAIRFPANTTALTYARGDSVTIESTALSVIAMVRTGQFASSVNRALTFLVKAKDGSGTWGSTSATILSLKALLSAMGGNQVKGTIPFTITVNGKEAAKGTVTEENSDVMQAFDLKALTQIGANQVAIEVQGETGLMYQIVARHFEPWKKEVTDKKPIMDVDVTYDRTKLSTNDMLRAKATLKYNGPIPTFNVILDLGIPPGFNVDAGDFAEMVGKKTVQKFSITGRQVILYLGDVKPGDVLNFEYTLKPKYPLRAKTPAAIAYEYYTPANRAEARPTELVVEERK